MVEPRKIDDDDELTQYGFSAPHPVFHDRPKPGWDAMSMILGRLTPLEAAVRVRGQIDAERMVGHEARYTTARVLRSAGFTVRHTPNRMNDLHVSVSPTAGSWNDASCTLFNSCFNEDAGGPTRESGGQDV